jgi:general secretion pathway protein L
LRQLRDVLGAFFAWWLGELAGLVPRQLRTWGRRERRRLVLAFDTTTVALLEPDGGDERELGRVALEASAPAAVLGEALAHAKRRTREVTIRLGANRGLRRILDLPLAARANLDQLLQFEMDRLTPFKPEQVCVAHRVASLDPATKRLQAEVHIAPREHVEQALDLAQALGLRPARVELAAPAGEDPSALDLLPQETTERKRSGRLTRALAVLALLLSAAAIAVPLQRQRTAATSLQEAVEAARVEAQQSVALRERLNRLTAAARFLVEAKHETPMVTEIVAELTRVIPDQAFVTQLYIDEGTVQLHGLAKAASDLIGQLEQSELFRAPRFRSPVTMDPGESLERFHIEVELQPTEES